MFRHRLIGLAVVFIMVFSLWCGLGVESVHADIGIQFAETQLTLNNSDQQNPDIYEYWYNNFAVVWQDNRNGNWDIYMYYQKFLGAGMWDVQWDSRITANSGNDINPKIYNDTIVYQSDRNGNWDIYMYNITSKVETQITNNSAIQEWPEVYGDIIVWQDHRNERWDYFHSQVQGLDIYIYNLTAKTEHRLPNPEPLAYNPAISGDNIVYTVEFYYQYSNTLVKPYVFSYNLSSGLKTNVAAGTETWRGGWGISTYAPSVMDFAAIDGTLIAWTDNEQRTVLVKDVSTGSTWQSPLSSWWMGNLDVNGNWVVYQDYISGNWRIKLLDFSSGVLYQPSNTLGNQQSPAISTKYANFMVYQDSRSGRWHIYLTSFWYGAGAGFPPSEPITPSRVIGQLQEFKSMIGDGSQIPTSDFAGANNKVRENRRNAMINQLDSAIASIEDAANTQDLKIRSKYLQSAINQLNDLINKVDGWSLRESADVAGSGFTPDWITAPLYLDQMIGSCRSDLQTLLKGIS